MRWSSFLGGAVLATVLALPAPAQLLGGGRLGQAVGGLTGGITGGALGNPATGQPGVVTAPLDVVHDKLQAAATPSDLLSLRRERLRALLRDNKGVLDADDSGDPVRRGEVLGIGLSVSSLATAEREGFTVIQTERIDGVDIVNTILAAPPKEPTRKALARLRAADPGGTYALDHIYQPAGGGLMPVRGTALSADAKGADTRIGLIDGGVGSHPAFAQAHVEQRGFAGNPKPSGHGTAVASLLVGNTGPFHGAAIGASLLVADVYGGSIANGSAAAIVRAMGWLAQRGARVINISLVGPANPLLDAAVKALSAKGIIVVAAVGNDGPAAPPQYPASYPGVVSVTGVDGRNRALIEAGRPTHLDFAAPGADMVGAVPGRGWETLRGTSFAAPLVAARLAARGSVSALGEEARAGIGKVGRGIVCGDCRIAPRSVGLK